MKFTFVRWFKMKLEKMWAAYRNMLCIGQSVFYLQPTLLYQSKYKNKNPTYLATFLYTIIWEPYIYFFVHDLVYGREGIPILYIYLTMHYFHILKCTLPKQSDWICFFFSQFGVKSGNQLVECQECHHLYHQVKIVMR